MNPAVLTALNLINQIFVANGNQEITGTNSNPVLQAILNSLYGITGDPEYLTTLDKTNLVSAINEVNDLVGQINSIKLFSGSANPNTVPPNGGDFELRDFYAQTSGGGNVGLWIYTGLNPNGWVNLNQRDIAWVATLPTTGLANVQYNRVTDNTIWRWFGGSGGGDPARWIQMGSKYTQIYPDLDSFPYPGDSDTFYIARDTRRGYIWNSGISAYAPLYEPESSGNVFTHSFIYDGSNAVQDLENPINELIDFQIENGCNYDDNLEIINPNQISVSDAVTNGILYEGNKVKIIYK